MSQSKWCWLFLCSAEDQFNLRLVEGVWANFSWRLYFHLRHTLLVSCAGRTSYLRCTSAGLIEHWTIYKSLSAKRKLSISPAEIWGDSYVPTLALLSVLSCHLFGSFPCKPSIVVGGQMQIVYTYFWTLQGCLSLPTTEEDTPVIWQRYCLDFMKLGWWPGGALNWNTWSCCTSAHWTAQCDCVTLVMTLLCAALGKLVSNWMWSSTWGDDVAPQNMEELSTVH